MLADRTGLGIDAGFAILRTFVAFYSVPVVKTAALALVARIKRAALLAALDTFRATSRSILKESPRFTHLLGTLTVNHHTFPTLFSLWDIVSVLRAQGTLSVIIQIIGLFALLTLRATTLSAVLATALAPLVVGGHVLAAGAFAAVAGGVEGAACEAERA